MVDATKPVTVSSGVPGLNELLGGGYPAGRLHLVQGSPGTGKTTLALQFLLAGVAHKESALYVTLSETREELIAVAHSHGWSLEGITLHELTAIEGTLGPAADNTVFHAAEIELGETVGRVLALATELRPDRVVFDSLSEMRLLAGDPLRYRRQVLAIKQFFARLGCTVLFLDDGTLPETDLQLQSIAHGVLSLERVTTQHGTARRRLQVVKMRGVNFRDGYHDFNIEPGGLVVFPRMQAHGSVETVIGGLLSSGNPQIDALLGGGLSRGTSTVVLGPAGAGKSNLCAQYVSAAAERGERAVIINFEETAAVLCARCAGIGLDLQPHLRSGVVQMRQVDPAELSPGELVHLVRRAVEVDGARVVVIDSLNGYLNSMPEERFLVVQLHELFTYLNEHGVSSFLVVAQHGLVGAMQTPVDVTYLADAVLLFRFFEAAGEVRQALSVVKKRTGQHERFIREFRISARGIEVGEPLSQFQGVLTGVPAFRGDTADLLRSAK